MAQRLDGGRCRGAFQQSVDQAGVEGVTEVVDLFVSEIPAIRQFDVA